MPNVSEIKILIIQPHQTCKGFGCRACQQSGVESAALGLADLIKLVAAAIADTAADTAVEDAPGAIPSTRADTGKL